jgi:HK97 family phage major capsid protein
MAVTDILNEVKTLHHDLKGRVDVLDKEQKKLGEELISKTGQMPAEYKENMDKIGNRISDLENLITTQSNELKSATASLDEYRLSNQRPPLLSKDGKKEWSAHHNSFIKAIRSAGKFDLMTREEKEHILQAYMPAERKALYAGDATTGGFFASTDFLEELQSYKLLISKLRGICRVQTTSAEKIQIPALAADTTAYWSTEQASFANSNTPTVGMITIPVHEMRGLLLLSQQNIEDSQFNLESFIKERLTLQFAKTEGLAFVSGDGNGKPRGILSYPIKSSASYAGGSAGKNNVTDAIAYMPSGNASTITADCILNVLMDLKADYAPNATWIMTRASLNSIRLLKDSQNRPLWQPFAGSNLPSTIYDRPYLEVPDMPEIAANAYPIIVGDFKNYMIVDRVMMSMQQLNELYAASGMIGFIARQRVGADLLIPEAMRVLKIATS